VPKTPKSGAGLERNHLPLSNEITCRFRPKSGAGLLRHPRRLGGAVDPAALLFGYCAAASFKGSPPWELHTTGDELLYILAGSSSLTVRGPEGEMLRNLRTGDLVVVPKGCWHRNDAPEGVTMLFVTPREGNQHRWEDPAAGGIVSPVPS
jgi:mannose-6-phosphate isomerase-like protein (cupin superfamily)